MVPGVTTIDTSTIYVVATTHTHMNSTPHEINVDAQQIRGVNSLLLSSSSSSSPPRMTTAVNDHRAMIGDCSVSEQQKISPVTVMKLSNNNYGMGRLHSATTLDSKLTLKTGKVIHDQPDFNLPPIHTPINPRSTIHWEDSIFSTSSSQQQQQQQQQQSPTHSRLYGSSMPVIPTLPEPKPFGRGVHRRSVSDDVKQQQRSGHRRSIFGHYFEAPRQQEQRQQPKQIQTPKSYPNSVSPPFHGRPRSQSLTDQSNTSLERSSSGQPWSATLGPQRYKFPDLEPLDYRMFAPPKSHATASTICRRFDSVEDHSDPSLLSSTDDLPPLPSPLQRFCSEPKHGLSKIHGMYPLMKPVSVLRQSSFRGTVATNNAFNAPLATKDGSMHHSGSYHRTSSTSSSSSSSRSSISVSELYDDQRQAGTPHRDKNTRELNGQGSFNLTNSFRPRDPRSKLFAVNTERTADNEDRALARRRLRNVGTLPTILSTGDMSVVQLDDDDDDEDLLELEFDKEDGDDSNGRVSSSFSSSSQRGVRFDPRITITEFEDDVERIWYTDWELEVLKRETIIIAQKYLMAHPLEAMKYSESKLDPLIGTYRKKALFSLPALTADDIRDDSTSVTSNRTAANSLPTDPKEVERLLQIQIKRILVVDPNPAILALFRKSMLTMFPFAEIVTAQNGDEAVKLLKENQSFDIVVIEQCLNLPCFRQARIMEPHHRRNKTVPSTLSIPKLLNEVSFPSLHKRGSFVATDEHTTSQSAGEARGLLTCGADLIKLFARKERADRALSKSRKNVTTTSGTMASGESSSMLQPRPAALLIGVSIKPDRDAKSLQQAGADIVWGKPPPKISDALAMQLLSLLLSKRRAFPLLSADAKAR